MKKNAPLLLTEDISIEPDHENRSRVVRLYADGLAKRLKTSIDVVHVENLSGYPVKDAFYKPLLRDYFSSQKTRLNEMAKSIQVPARAMFVNGDPVDKILSLASKRGAYEAIVLGTHGRKGLSRLILGSVAEETLRRASIPVVTIGPKAQEAGVRSLSAKGARILVPTGLTANSDRAEKYALKLAKRLDARIVLLHCLNDSLHPVLQTAFSSPESGVRLTDLFGKLRTEATRSLAAKAARLKKAGIQATFILDAKTLTSSEAVLREATAHSADLIVMGTHGRTLIAGAFLGRTVRGVILESPVPVITVKSRAR